MARSRTDSPDSGTNQTELAEQPPPEDKPIRVYAIRRGEYGGHRLVVAEMPTSVLEKYAFREDEPDPLWISLARLNREVQIQVEKG